MLEVLTPMVFMICIGGGVTLLLRNNGQRARIFLGVAMCLLAIRYGYRIWRQLAVGFSGPVDDIMNPLLCIGSVFFLLVMLAYPIELVRPGWLNWRRALRLSLPAICVVAVFLLGSLIGGSFTEIDSYAELKADIGRFNVWFRFIVALTTLGYGVWVLVLLARSARRFQLWTAHADEGVERRNDVLRWVTFYCGGLLAIGIAYIFVLLDFWPVPEIIHATLVMVFLAFVLYKCIFYDNLYPDAFLNPDPAAELRANGNFEPRIAEYVEVVNHWLQEKKPYLDPSFKLTDTMKIVPLNRSYISRIYNEGFGMSFSELVRSLRLEEACRLLRTQPELTVTEVAERSGFASHSSFHRSFTTEFGGRTPGEYRAEYTGQNAESRDK